MENNNVLIFRVTARSLKLNESSLLEDWCISFDYSYSLPPANKIFPFGGGGDTFRFQIRCQFRCHFRWGGGGYLPVPNPVVLNFFPLNLFPKFFLGGGGSRKNLQKLFAKKAFCEGEKTIFFSKLFFPPPTGSQSRRWRGGGGGRAVRLLRSRRRTVLFLKIVAFYN